MSVDASVVMSLHLLIHLCLCLRTSSCLSIWPHSLSLVVAYLLPTVGSGDSSQPWNSIHPDSAVCCAEVAVRAGEGPGGEGCCWGTAASAPTGGALSAPAPAPAPAPTVHHGAPAVSPSADNEPPAAPTVT